MENQNSEKNINKTPSKMARLAWPKSKYGVIIAIIIFIVVNLIYYKDFFLSLFNKKKYAKIMYGKKLSIDSKSKKNKIFSN